MGYSDPRASVGGKASPARNLDASSKTDGTGKTEEGVASKKTRSLGSPPAPTPSPKDKDKTAPSFEANGFSEIETTVRRVLRSEWRLCSASTLLSSVFFCFLLTSSDLF